jgi:hypothetical protein
MVIDSNKNKMYENIVVTYHRVTNDRVKVIIATLDGFEAVTVENPQSVVIDAPIQDIVAFCPDLVGHSSRVL